MTVGEYRATVMEAFYETQAILRQFVRRFARNRHDVDDITTWRTS